MPGHRRGEFAVGGRYKGNSTVASSFLPQQIENGTAIAETGGVEMNAACELVLHISAPSQEPHRQEKQGDGAGFQKSKNAFPQQITPDQSAVQIYAQYRRRFSAELGSCRAHENDGRKRRYKSGEELARVGNLGNMRSASHEG